MPSNKKNTPPSVTQAQAILQNAIKKFQQKKRNIYSNMQKDIDKREVAKILERIEKS